jgi:ArsR family transcriptional regulator, arsenate/arsenite/antimonite-responsive transcriptional repressor / arsenate reductase (thioredoxin)
VCDTAHEELGDAGCVHWSVPDPVRDGTDAAFDAAFEDIAARIQSLAPRLTTTKG